MRVLSPGLFLWRGLCAYNASTCAEKENLCLYGFPDEGWEVNLPSEEVPPELPEPALGINFARDGMLRKDWLSLVAVHSDAWLLAVSYFYGARLDKNERLALNCRRRFLGSVNSADGVRGLKFLQCLSGVVVGPALIPLQ